MNILSTRKKTIGRYDEYISIKGSTFGKRFHYELGAIIRTAERGKVKRVVYKDADEDDKAAAEAEAAEIAATNLLHYFIESNYQEIQVRTEVVIYLTESINDLHVSERIRLAKGLGIKSLEFSTEELLDNIHKISPKAKKRLITKICIHIGNPKQTNKEESERLRIGARVSYLHQKYRDRDSLHYEKTKEKGLEPLERAIIEVADVEGLKGETTRRAYHVYRELRETGCIDEYGEFILLDNRKKLSDSA